MIKKVLIGAGVTLGVLVFFAALSFPGWITWISPNFYYDQEIQQIKETSRLVQECEDAGGEWVDKDFFNSAHCAFGEE